MDESERGYYAMTTNLEHVTWMGGSSPLPVIEISVEEYAYAMELYFEQREEYRAYWKDHGRQHEQDYAEMFWNRARHDAHATYREATS